MIAASEYQVAIPSYRRASTIAQKTLPMLRSGGVDMGRVTVFVCDDEREEYEPIAAEFAVRLARAEPTLKAARNIIARHYPPDYPVVEVDDDIKRLMRRVDEKTVETVADLDAVFRRGFEVADKAGARLWGLYPVPNPYFMRDEVTTDLRYIGGGLFGVRFAGDDADLVELDDKEDFERTCRAYLRDGSVVRFGDVTWDTVGYGGDGGMQSYRTPETIAEGARRMVELFPDLCTLNLTKRSGHAEVRLRDRRPEARMRAARARATAAARKK